MRDAEPVAAGYLGRMAPVQTQGSYAAMVDDPDGHVILLTSDEAGLGWPRPCSEGEHSLPQSPIHR